MRIRFLGTAAAEGWPGVFCDCESCQRAKAAGGKNIRTRCSIQIDEVYKVDLPPDTYLHALRYGIDLLSVEHLLITHAHQDHIYAKELNMRAYPFSAGSTPKTLHVYGNSLVGELLKREVPELSKCKVEFHIVRPFQRFRAGDLSVLALPANHDRGNQDSLIYAVERMGKNILVSFDTASYLEETWEQMIGIEFDLLIMDCTYGPFSSRGGHMGLGDIVEIKRKMERLGMLKEGARVIATHFSHNGGLLHEEMEDRFRPYGIEVAYDGMEVEV
jgi:phosphoribosyl 1,2-cyclic phosphate phosphodiesterase